MADEVTRVELLEAKVLELERRLAGWMDMMGWQLELLPYTSKGIEELLDEIDELLRQTHRRLDPEKLRKWARLLLSISPPYLRLVAKHRNPPWKPFLDLAFVLVRHASIDQLAEGELFYAGLEIGRRNAMQAGYLWALESQGARPYAAESLDGTLSTRLVELHRYLYHGSVDTLKR